MTCPVPGCTREFPHEGECDVEHGFDFAERDSRGRSSESRPNGASAPHHGGGAESTDAASEVAGENPAAPCLIPASWARYRDERLGEYHVPVAEAERAWAEAEAARAREENLKHGHYTVACFNVDRADEAEKRLAMARALLRTLEWAGWDHTGSCNEGDHEVFVVCPCCEGRKAPDPFHPETRWGHAEDCALAAWAKEEA